MEKEKCFFLGSITKAFGYKGEVVIFIDADQPEVYAGIDSVFIEIDNKLIPFFIERSDLRNKSNQLTVKLEGIDTHDQALQLQGCALYLPLELLPALEGTNFYFHEIVGYKASDVTKGFIGIVVQVLDYPGNPIFEIENQGKQILIPVRDEFIAGLDREQREILLKAPEGLIDLYLKEE